MNLFTYLMSKKGYNYLPHDDLFSYLLGKNNSIPNSASGTEITINSRKGKLISLNLTKESTQSGIPSPDSPQEIKTVKGYRNLLPNNGISQTIYGVTFTKNNDGTIVCNGTATETINSYRFAHNVVLTAGTYTISGCPSGGGTGNGKYRITDINGEFDDVGNGETQTFSETKTKDFYIQIYKDAVCNNLTFKPMIVEGTEELSYVPYGNNYVAVNITNGTNTKNITIPLNNNEIAGIGTYKDELIVDSDGHYWLNKKTGKLILNGSETGWSSFKADNNIYNYYIKEEKIKKDLTNLSCLSNYFVYRSYGNNLVGQFQIGDNNPNKNGNIVFNPFNDTTNELATFKNWLSTHNTEVLYPLQTPELIDLNYTVDMTIFKGTNTITNSENADMVIEYF